MSKSMARVVVVEVLDILKRIIHVKIHEEYKQR